MSCSYSDIEQLDKNALKYNPAVIGWQRFRDDIFLAWPHSTEYLDLIFNYMNNIDKTKKIQFTTGIAEDVLEFLDLKVTLDKKYKHIMADVFSKATNSFRYVLPVFLRKSLKTFLKVSDYDQEKFAILMTSLKNTVSSIRNF